MSSSILEMISGGRNRAQGSSLEKLTDREFEVFQLIGQGQGTRDIAEKLHLSVKTIDVHRANIKAKLKVQSASELIRFAVRWTESQGTGHQ
jgi:DNA-binding NarL/FixJ family response regulator